MKFALLLYFLSVFAICGAKRAYEINDNEIQIIAPGTFNVTHDSDALEILVVNNAHIYGKYLLCVGPTSVTQEFCPEGLGLIELYYSEVLPEKRYYLDHHGKLRRDNPSLASPNGYYHAPVLPEKFITIHVPSVLTDVSVYLQNAKIYKPKDPGQTDITKVVNRYFFFGFIHAMSAGFFLIFIATSILHYRIQRPA